MLLFSGKYGLTIINFILMDLSIKTTQHIAIFIFNNNCEIIKSENICNIFHIWSHSKSYFDHSPSTLFLNALQIFHTSYKCYVNPNHSTIPTSLCQGSRNE